MRLRTVPLLAAVAVVLLAAGIACSSSGKHTVEGVILKVNSSSITQVDSFTLLVKGEVLDFKVAPDAAKDPQEGFSPGHLREHALASQPVKITYRVENGERLALSLAHG